MTRGYFNTISGVTFSGAGAGACQVLASFAPLSSSGGGGTSAVELGAEF
jgi:hypothetical protein